MLKGCLSLLVVFLALLSLPVPAGAQTKDPKAVFNQGVEYASKRQFQEAVDTLLGVLPDMPPGELPRVHKALAYSYKNLGSLPEAWYHLAAYLESTTEADRATGSWLEEVESELKKSHIKVMLSCQPEAVVLRFADAQGEAGGPSYSCPLTWWFSPGEHQVHASRPGFEPKAETISIKQRGERGFYSIVLTPEKAEPVVVPAVAVAAPVPEVAAPKPTPATPKAPAKPPTVLTSKPGAPQTSGQGPGWLEWSLVGGGSALVLAGGAFWWSAYSLNEDLRANYSNRDKFPDALKAQKLYDQRYEDSVSPRQLTGYVLGGLGAAALTGGLVLIFTRGPAKAPAKKSAWVPAVDQDFTGLSWIYAF